ncbi:hypothetical protein [Nocardia vaccinii]|uniref:hypothetical protein n=1 Tax=Nocardia vaccinii TaxID=1822 RepID=UPI00082CBA41|nr:hypothetical protein [Nocardia vaccinii]
MRDGIVVNAVAPGSVPTNLSRHLGRPAGVTLEDGLRKTVEQGAATSILLAVSPLLDGSAAGTSPIAPRRWRSPGGPP